MFLKVFQQKSIHSVNLFTIFVTSYLNLEPTYHSILVFEQNPIAWMFKNGCLIFKDIWSSDKMQFEPNLRFYKVIKINLLINHLIFLD